MLTLKHYSSSRHIFSLSRRSLRSKPALLGICPTSSYTRFRLQSDPAPKYVLLKHNISTHPISLRTYKHILAFSVYRVPFVAILYVSFSQVSIFYRRSFLCWSSSAATAPLPPVSGLMDHYRLITLGVGGFNLAREMADRLIWLTILTGPPGKAGRNNSPN